MDIVALPVSMTLCSIYTRLQLHLTYSNWTCKEDLGMSVDTYKIIGQIDKFAELWRDDRKESARKIAREVAASLYNTPGIEPKLYRYLVYNLRFLDDQPFHIVMANIDTQCKYTPDDIINSRNCAGSEEALYAIALEFVKMGHRVTIICNVPYFHGCTLPGMNPRFYPLEGYKGLDVGKVDAVLAWRRTDFFRLSYFAGNAPVYYCPHDWFVPTPNERRIRGCMFLTEQQKRSYWEHIPRMREIPTIIGGNGCYPDLHHLSADREPYRCIYASSYPRGLLGVLNVWKDIRSAYPKATLHICYGRETFGLGTKEELEEIVSKIEALKDYGVEEAGRLPQAEVNKAMNRASFIVNTSKFMETYGIVFVKAMASGVIPVITNSVDRAIVPAEIELLDKDSPSLEHDFKTRLLEMMDKDNRGELDALRRTCRDHVLAKHTWEKSAQKMIKFIQDTL